MSAALNTLSVTFYDGRSPVGQPVTLIWSGGTVKLIGSAIAQTYPTHGLRVSPRIGRAERFIALPDGAQLQCADHPLLDRLPQEGRTEGLVAWLEQRWHIAVACVALTVGGLAAGYFYGLPVVADRIAAQVPIEFERTLGEKTMTWLDDQKFFEKSALAPEMQEELRAGFAELAHGLPMQDHLQLEFRDAPTVGANAFALPGGTIVITDQMIGLSESPEEVYAVLAHEIAHVERRHALRHVIQDSATAAIAATFTSDVSSLTLAVSGIPVLLAQAKYSREFETEADDYAFDLLHRHNLSPTHFATLMERMNDTRNPDTERRMAFLSTHPVTADRIARAYAAARK